jgi:Glycosyl transferase family 2
MRNKFSIVIPTRDRKATLGPCIASCLLQSHPNYEIVVQDNASNDGTAELVKSISDTRVNYFRSPTRLSMRGNFEAALANSNGEYVIMIGDDDGIVPGALNRLDKLTSAGDVDFVSWPTLYYFWPGYDPTGTDFGLALKRGNVFGATQPVSSGSFAYDLASAKSVHFRRIPKIYHGCVSRRLIDSIKSKTGTVFNYDIPDLYFQVASTLIGAKGRTQLHPASIIGASTNSTGTGQFGNKSGELDTGSENSFGRFMQEAAMDAPAVVPFNPHFTSIDYYTYASLVIAAAQFRPDLEIDHEAWIKRVVTQLSQNPAFLRIAKQASVISELDQRLVNALKDVREPVSQPVSAASGGQGPTNLSLSKQINFRKTLSRCRLLTDIDGVDNILTATQVLDQAFADRHHDTTHYPGWQAMQLLRWGQMIASTRDRVVG